MNVLVKFSSDTIVRIYECGDNMPLSLECYIVQVDEVSDKFVPKGLWKELKDENDNPVWEQCDETGLSKPSMGYVISSQVRVKFKLNPYMWTVEEILKEKYEKRLKDSKLKNNYYQEFVTFDKILYDGHLNIGKKFCAGHGVLIHEFEQSIKDFLIETEFVNNLPQMYVSNDNETWTKIDSNSFCFKFKKESNKFYLKVDDDNALSAYSIYY